MNQQLFMFGAKAVALADGIIVLGCAHKATQERRIRMAYELWRALPVDSMPVIVSGKMEETHAALVQFKNYGQRLPLIIDSMPQVTSDHGRTVKAAYEARTGQPFDGKQFHLVTTASHMPRAICAFRDITIIPQHVYAANYLELPNTVYNGLYEVLGVSKNMHNGNLDPARYHKAWHASPGVPIRL